MRTEPLLSRDLPSPYTPNRLSGSTPLPRLPRHRVPAKVGPFRLSPAAARAARAVDARLLVATVCEPVVCRMTAKGLWTHWRQGVTVVLDTARTVIVSVDAPHKA